MIAQTLVAALFLLSAGRVAAASAAPLPSPDKSFVYKKIDGAELRLHAFFPSGWRAGDKRPAIVFFFGGGWVGGSPDQFYPHCRYLASRGMAAFAAEYRVRNRHGTSPRKAVMDAKSTVRWIRKRAADLGADPNRLAAGGGSAGGHLAAATAFVKKFNDPRDDLSTSCRPDALVLFNPVIDNGPEGYGYERVKAYWKDISPLHNIGENPPPTIFFLGTKDRLVPVAAAEKFKKLIEQRGGRCELRLYKDKTHGFFNLRRDRACYRQTLLETDRFLASLGWLKGPPAIRLHAEPVPEEAP